jgi:hypothetical protein
MRSATSSLVCRERALGVWSQGGWTAVESGQTDREAAFSQPSRNTNAVVCRADHRIAVAALTTVGETQTRGCALFQAACR